MGSLNERNNRGSWMKNYTLALMYYLESTKKQKFIFPRFFDHASFYIWWIGILIFSPLWPDPGNHDLNELCISYLLIMLPYIADFWLIVFWKESSKRELIIYSYEISWPPFGALSCSLGMDIWTNTPPENACLIVFKMTILHNIHKIFQF